MLIVDIVAAGDAHRPSGPASGNFIVAPLTRRNTGQVSIRVGIQLLLLPDVVRK
jgi:hypothetical protein